MSLKRQERNVFGNKNHSFQGRRLQEQRLKAELDLSRCGDTEGYIKGLFEEKPQVAVKAKGGLESEGE